MLQYRIKPFGPSSIQAHRVMPSIPFLHPVPYHVFSPLILLLPIYTERNLYLIVNQHIFERKPGDPREHSTPKRQHWRSCRSLVQWDLRIAKINCDHFEWQASMRGHILFCVLVIAVMLQCHPISFYMMREGLTVFDELVDDGIKLP